MRQADGSPVPGVRDNDILERGPFKIGVFGVALPYTPQLSSSGDLKFGPTMDTVRAQAKALRDRGADIVVCVAHTDRADDLAIMQSRAVDVLLTGHDHDLALTYDGRVVMAESNEEANYVTVVDLAVTATMAGNTRTVTWSPSFRIIDSRTVTPDPDTLALVKNMRPIFRRNWMLISVSRRSNWIPATPRCAAGKRPSATSLPMRCGR